MLQATSSTSRRSPAASDEIVWEAGQKADAEEGLGVGAPALQAHRSTPSPRASTSPTRGSALADSYFEEGGTGNYILAVSSYRDFLTLYPSHPRRLRAVPGRRESYFKQKNSPDRDQTSTEKALEEYERLLDVVPASRRYVEETRGRASATAARASPAPHYQVGYFYQKTRRSWRSAIARYETILSEYPDYERIDEVLFRLGQVLSFAGRYAEARPQLARLRSEFPAEPLRGRGRQARSQLSALGARCSAGRSRDHPRACHAASFSRSTSSVTLRIRANTP